MQRQLSRAWIEIDLGALVRNGERFEREAGRPILPMVKADAYGLGAVRVARALEPISWGFGVATVEEGEELRRARIDKPILVFSPLLPTQFDAARRALQLARRHMRAALDDGEQVDVAEQTNPVRGGQHSPLTACEATPNHDRHPNPEGREATLTQRIPLGRLGRPEDIAPLITFLCTPDASYATGAFFVVDGGLSVA